MQHPEYDEKPLGDDVISRRNDIALLKLSPAAKLSPSIGIVCLPDETDESLEARDFVFSGWGRSGNS